jgi:flagellar protein FliO/FliZ
VREPPRTREPQPPAVAAEAPFDAEADQNLADMAQRLEAALRRPGKPGEPRPAEGAPRPAAANAESAPPAPARSPAPAEGSLARAEAKPARSLYDSLEKEMASLLGRPGGKT